MNACQTCKQPHDSPRCCGECLLATEEQVQTCECGQPATCRATVGYDQKNSRFVYEVRCAQCAKEVTE